MTADLREAMALAPWGPVTVKKEEEEEENFLGQASSQQVHSGNIKVWAPGEGPQTGLDVAEQEEKVNNGVGGRRRRDLEISSGFRGDMVSLLAHLESCWLAMALSFSPLEYDRSILFGLK